MITEEQFESSLAGLVNLIGLTLDFHAVLGHCSTSGHQAVAASNFDNTDHAGSEWLTAGAETKGGDINSQLLGGIEYG